MLSPGRFCAIIIQIRSQNDVRLELNKTKSFASLKVGDASHQAS